MFYILNPHECFYSSWDIHFNFVKGLTGNKGNVVGKARILKSHKNAEIEENSILIYITTDPNYLPFMKKAAAFVTDEGRITSHAAIVAREMGKPCIIGTKHATKVFKDGDLLEVDANQGIVKILKKAKK